MSHTTVVCVLWRAFGILSMVGSVLQSFDEAIGIL